MSVDAQLDRLEASGLVRIAALHPELEYLFRHSLVQNTAYDSLLKRERRKLHLLVAEAIEELYAGRLDEFAAELAFHFEEAGDERAIRHLMAAARHAQRRFAIYESRSHYDRARRLIPAESTDPEATRLRIEVAIGSAEAGWLFSDPDQEIASLEETVQMADALGDERLLVKLYSLIAMLRQYQGERYGVSAPLTSAIDRATQISDKLGDPGLRAGPLAQMGWALAEAGDRRRGAELLEEAAPLFEQQGKVTDLGLLLDSLALFYSQLGEFKLAEERLQRADELAEQSDPIAKLDAASIRGAMELFRNRPDAAMRSASWCASKAEEMGVLACSIGSHMIVGMAHLGRGRPDLALPALDRGLELSVLSLKFWQPMLGAVRATAEAMLGNMEQAAEGWRGALERAREIGDSFVEASVLHMRASAGSMAPNPDWGWILPDLSESVTLFEKLETRPFLARALRDYGTALRQAGRGQDAEEAFSRSLELFVDMELDLEAETVRAILSAS